MSRKSDNAFPRRFTIQEEARTQLGRAWQGYLRWGSAVSAILCIIWCDGRSSSAHCHSKHAQLAVYALEIWTCCRECPAGGPLCGGRPAT